MKRSKVRSLVIVACIALSAAFFTQGQSQPQPTGKLYAGLGYATGAGGKEGLILSVWGSVHSAVSGAVYGAVFGGPAGFAVGLGVGL